MTATWTDLQLSDEHRAMLQDSGVSPDVAAERGYFTARTPDEVPDVFSRPQRQLVPALVLPSYSVDGADGPTSYEIRPDEPRTDGRSQKVRKYEAAAGQSKRLDVPVRVRPWLSDPSKPLYVTEGVRKSDSAASIGLACIALAGVWSFRGKNVDGGKTELPCWEKIALNGREVFIAFDSDVATKEPVKRAMARLVAMLKRREAKPRILVFPAGPGNSKVGLDDLIASGADEQQLLSYAADDFLTDERQLDVRLRDFVLDAYALGQDLDGNPYGLPNDGPRLVRMIDTGRPNLYTEAPVRFSQNEPGQPVVPQRTVRDVMAYVSGLAQSEEPTPLHLRSARLSGGIVLDLGDPTGRAAVVSPSGWKVVSEAPALFRRTEYIKPLPVPEKGGSLDQLRELLNVTDETWPLVMGWLLAALFEDVPRPWAYFAGPQGSGKSEGARLVLSVLDPRQNLLKPPGGQGDRHDAIAYASGAFLMSYDNVSKLSADTSDFLCAVVTGTSESRRVLHTTASSLSLTIMRSGALTGIDVSGIRPDLMERLVSIEFGTIPDHQRRTHRDIVDRFRATHPQILGALLDAVSVALRHLPDINAGTLGATRMGDYATILAAYDAGAGTNLFQAYKGGVTEALTDLAEDDPFASAVMAFVRERGAVRLAPDELHDALSQWRLATHGIDDTGSFWPTSPRTMGRALRKAAGPLKGHVLVAFGRSNGRRWVALTPVEGSITVVAEDADSAVNSAVSAVAVPSKNPLTALPLAGETGQSAVSAVKNPEKRIETNIITVPSTVSETPTTGDRNPTQLSMLRCSSLREPAANGTNGTMTPFSLLKAVPSTSAVNGTEPDFEAPSLGSLALTAVLSDIASVVSVHGFIPGEIHRYGPTETDAFVLPTSWEPVTLLPPDGRTEPVASAGQTVDPFVVGLRCGTCGTRVVLMPAASAGAPRDCPRCGTSYPTYVETADEMLEAA